MSFAENLYRLTLENKSVEVTKRYLAIDNRENAEAVRPLSPMDKKFRQTGAKIQR